MLEGEVEALPDLHQRLIDLAGTREGLEDLPVAVLVIDAHSREIVFRNAEARRIASKHGWPQALIGESGRIQLLHPDGSSVPDEERPAYRAMVRGERVENVPLLMPCLDGSTLSVVMSATPLYDDQDAIVGGMLMLREVRERSEQRLLFSVPPGAPAREKARRRLLLLLEEATRDLTTPEEIASVTTHLVGMHLKASRCCYGAVDVDADLVRVFEGYASGVQDTPGTSRLSSFGAVLARQMAGLTDVISDTQADPLTRDAYETTYGPMGMRAFIGVPLVKNGRFTAFFTVNQNEPRQWNTDEVRLVQAVAARTWLTVDHLEAQRALRERESQFRALVEGIPQFVWSTDRSGAFQYLGPQWQRYTGQSPDANDGASALEAIHPEDVDRVRAQWNHAMRSDLPFEAEFRIRRSDGAYRYFSARARPVHTLNGEVVQWMGTTTDVHEMRMMQAALEERTRQLGRAYGETYERLVRAAALRDDDTADHTGRVGRLASRIAASLGYDEKEATELCHAAELHDLGKIGIPDSILHKPGKLTSEERSLMETHTTLGASLLEGGESSLLQRATTIALCHHERWDGEGYPRRLKGTAIPLEGRIVAVADAYDAMTHNRPYRAALSPEEARARLLAGRASQWDADIIEVFLELDAA